MIGDLFFAIPLMSFLANMWFNTIGLISHSQVKCLIPYRPRVIAAYDYVSRIMVLPLCIVTLVFSTLIYPYDAHK